MWLCVVQSRISLKWNGENPCARMGTIKYSVELVRRTIYKAHHPTAAQQYGHFFIYLFVCGHARTNISKPKTTEKIWGKNHTYTGKWCFVKKKNKEKKWRNTKQRNNVEHVISSSCWNECFWLDIDTINQICIFIAHQSELSSIIENLIKMVGGAHVGDIHFVV